MSPSERDMYDKLYAQHVSLQEDYRKLRVQMGNAKTVKVKASPAGKIDARGVRDSGKVGVAGGLVGAWSDDILNHIDLAINHAGGTIKFIYGLAMVEDVVGFIVGFLVLGLATAFVKLMKDYG